MNEMTSITMAKRQFRAGQVIETRAADGDRRVRPSFSSEEPVEQAFGIEVLGHGPGEVRIEWIGSGRAPLLVDHRRGMDHQVGVIESVRIGGGRGVAQVRFGKSDRARDLLERVRDGEISAVSVARPKHFAPGEKENPRAEARGLITPRGGLASPGARLPLSRS